MTNTSTKVSGLELNTDYTFQLILRTTAGTFPSNVIKIRTHTMNDTSGICVCFGNVGSGPNAEIMLDNTKLALEEMGAKWSDKIEIDTTHFVCTTPAASGQDPGTGSGAPGVLYQRALQLSIPVIQPEWILACHSEKRYVDFLQCRSRAEPSAQDGTCCPILPRRHPSHDHVIPTAIYVCYHRLVGHAAAAARAAPPVHAPSLSTG